MKCNTIIKSVFLGLSAVIITGVAFAQETQLAKVSPALGKTFSSEVEKLKVKERMSFGLKLPEQEVAESMLDAVSGKDDPVLMYDKLSTQRSVFHEKSLVKGSFIEAGLLKNPPVNYIYIYEVPKPERFKEWQVEIFNSKGEQIWTAGAKSKPTGKLMWDGYDTEGKWRAFLGEQYSFVLKAKEKKTNELVFVEEPFMVDSYIHKTDKNLDVRFSLTDIFDNNALNISDEGKQILQKIFYVMKSSSFKKGTMTLKSDNPSLAKVQMDRIKAFARDNRVNLNDVKTSVTSASRSINHGEIILTK